MPVDQTWKKNHLIDHPAGGQVFGVIPAIASLQLEEAFVYLRMGEHRALRGSAPSGFGVRHIWEGKQRELVRHGCLCIDDVPAFIASLFVLGAELYHDRGHAMAHKKRVTLLRTLEGTLVLEPIHDRQLGGLYSVVTWTPRRTPRGVLVGTIQRSF